ncbi:glutamyl-Q tRNA(Asp) synthetase [Tranquillimonas rosea]|uniref:Glutamyl-Q tRNA(Asp) synthetase n=1 Tax=Tranquillimonas rosea TaxID=641238 RepID=A0A1H9PCF3_9RHOB|nr:tRNA glutamyl-Q(34) synthetase GluQRS [Tranquillimonas rosea]SER45837.1 glutamyl-Q tRNA(Asp) synthetase [Tranquillimonas rosea]
MTLVTRFAPSPTGPLHLGHAFSALTAHDLARDAGGTLLLRIEDIDRARSKPEWETAIHEDLRWLGLRWPEPVMRQSDRLDLYRQTLDQMWREGLLFACSCTRRDIREALSAPQEGAMGPDGLIYPGTCRAETVHRHPVPPDGTALRLDMGRAWDRLGTDTLTYDETGPERRGRHTISRDAAVMGIGDPVLARKDIGTSYHLSVVLDDAAQGITEVVRGLDLFDATGLHVILQALLDLPRPRYHHHRLIRDDAGKRLAKRDDARAIAAYRHDGLSPDDLRRLVGLPAR